MDLLAPNKNMNAMTEMNDIDCTSTSSISSASPKSVYLHFFMFIEMKCLVVRLFFSCVCCYCLSTKNKTHTKQMSVTIIRHLHSLAVELRYSRVNVIQQFVCSFCFVFSRVHQRSHGCNFSRVSLLRFAKR